MGEVRKVLDEECGAVDFPVSGKRRRHSFTSFLILSAANST